MKKHHNLLLAVMVAVLAFASCGYGEKIFGY